MILPNLFLENTHNRGVDATIDAVGFEAKGSAVETVLTTLKIEGSSGKALRQCIAATRRGGVVSVPGVYAGFIHGFFLETPLTRGCALRWGRRMFRNTSPICLITLLTD